ncbi:hypothetical protein [Parabacteroides goldsteinii]
MKSSVLYFILIMAVLVGCTKDNEPVLDRVINQNEVNINQLKQIAASSGWHVSPRVEKGGRTTPLTEGEIKEFKEDLQEYSVYPKMQEEREVEVVPIGDRYILMLPFTPKLLTKSTSGGSVMVNATFGFCPGGKCDQIPIKILYDLDENGNITYAFGGCSADYNIWSKEGIECLFCRKLVKYSTIYYECSWSSESVAITIWANQIIYRNWDGDLSNFTTTDHKYLKITGSVNIKGGFVGFDTHEIGEDELPPIVTTGL